MQKNPTGTFELYINCVKHNWNVCEWSERRDYMLLPLWNFMERVLENRIFQQNIKKYQFFFILHIVTGKLMCGFEGYKWNGTWSWDGLLNIGI